MKAKPKQPEYDFLIPQKERPVLTMVGIKVGDEDREAIVRKAKRHAEGNVSAWIRHSAKAYIPKKNERIPKTTK
jgi:hypothetical protein